MKGSSRSANSPYVDLTIALTRPAVDQYWVELRFTQLDAQAEQTLASGPARFDLDALGSCLVPAGSYGRLLMKAILGHQNLREYFLQALPAAGAGQKELRLACAHRPKRRRAARSALGDVARSRRPGFPSVKGRDTLLAFPYSSDWRPIELRHRGSLSALIVVANPTSIKQGMILLQHRFGEVDVDGEVDRARSALHGVPDVEVLESRRR